MKRILVVADDPFERDYLTEVLKTWSYQVEAVGSCREAASQELPHDYSLYLIAATLPDGSGIELCRRLRALVGGVPIIVFSKYEGNVTLAIEAGADAFVRTGSGLATLLGEALHLISDISVTKKPSEGP